ncbi:MAG TPA: NUDIX hydrolase [Ktedonobacterales bacterium]|jgi:8-oxo-dGTP pyrophosphatase MutT (NUDIX family)
MPRPRVVRAFSAGGIVFRLPAVLPSKEANAATAVTPGSALAGVEVVLVGYRRDDTWTLPKGTPKDGETIEETALREVGEETGIQARIVGDLGSIQYSFGRRGVRYEKEVRHFLMEATGGDVSLHDAEYDEARWFGLAEAMRRLTYANETEVVRRAEALIGQLLAGGER